MSTNLTDTEFLDHCERLLDGGGPFRADEAARLFRLAGETAIADVLAEAAGIMPYYFPTVGPVLVAAARKALAT